MLSISAAYESAGFQRIEVDINSLDDFAAALRQELNTNLIPALRTIIPELGQAHFAVHPELRADLGTTRTDYEEYLASAKNLLLAVMAGTEQLAESAEKIAAAYSKADQFARIKADDVHRVLPDIKPSATSSGKPIAL
jgi:hypothetical protein